MSYLICSQPISPKLDTLPTYKIIHYPLEPRDYKPFAQAKLCIIPQELLVQMWAFEMVPQPESLIRAVFTAPNSQNLLVLTAQAEGGCSCLVRSPNGDKPLDAIIHALNGEDLQGVYWGATITLRRATIEEFLGQGATHVGSTLRGNFYKLSNSPQKPHRGSLYPADFAGGREYALPSLGEFKIVAY